MERRWKVLIAVSVAVFMVSLDLFIVNIAFPAIRTDFHGSSNSSLSWVLTAYAIVFSALLIPAGRLADKIGRRRVFLTGLLVFLVGSALCGVAPSVETLIGARVVQAVGAAMLLPTSLALLLPEFPPAQRAAAIGIWAAVGGVAAAFGPPVGGLLVQASWRWVFLVNIPVGLIAGRYAMLVLRESRDERPEPLPDWIGTILLTLSVAALSLGLVKAPEWGWLDTRTIVALAGAAIGLAWFWQRCATQRYPVVDLSMLRVRSFAMANTSALLFAVAFAAMLLSSILFLTGVWHYSITRAGFAIAPGPMLAATFAGLSGRWANRFGQRYLIAVGGTLFAAAMAWRYTFDATPHYVTQFLPGMILSGVGVGLVLPSVASAAASSLPPERFATGSAVVTMARQLGFVLGVSILFAVLGNPAPSKLLATFDHVWTFMVAASLMAAATGLAIGRVAQNRAPAKPDTVVPDAPLLEVA